MSGAAAAAATSAVVEKASVSRGADERREDERREEEARWLPVLELPCQFAVELPLPNFKVADFLRLRAGSVIATGWRVTHDVPLRVNGTLIGWGEFDGSGSRLAVRLTELA
jgi:flagellar motor switch/type III secretory pathway protein FliN